LWYPISTSLLTDLCRVVALHGVLVAHCLLDAINLLLVAALVFHRTLFSLLQCTLQGLNSLSRSPKTCSVSGTFSPNKHCLAIVSFKTLFFSFSFSNFFFHCSAVNSKFTDAVFLIVLALKWQRA
uniref:Uncharacterized protein n=1 Tax=Anolis carolinensis TaxID=28377 RepID=A0A803T9T6_ANOCA